LAKAALTSKLDLILRENPVKFFTWRIALFVAETRTLRTLDQKYLECFEMLRRRTVEIIWTDLVKN
jgi:hypothetical protein